MSQISEPVMTKSASRRSCRATASRDGTVVGRYGCLYPRIVTNKDVAVGRRIPKHSRKRSSERLPIFELVGTPRELFKQLEKTSSPLPVFHPMLQEGNLVNRFPFFACWALEVLKSFLDPDSINMGNSVAAKVSVVSVV